MQAKRAADLVDHQRRQGLALDVLGDHQERLAGLGDGLEDREQILHRRDLLLVDEQVGILELGFHALGIGYEIGRQIAAVELHALNHFQSGFKPFGFLDRDHALLADFLHRLGNDVADGGVVVGRDRADLGDFAAILGRFGHALEFGNHSLDGPINTPFDRHRVVGGRDHLNAFVVNRTRQNRSGGGAVTGYIRGLGGYLLDHLRAHVFELVFELDLLGHGDAVFGYGRRPKAFIEHHVAALGTECHGYRVSQDVDPFLDLLAGFLAKANNFGWHSFLIPPIQNLD